MRERPGDHRAALVGAELGVGRRAGAITRATRSPGTGSVCLVVVVAAAAAAILLLGPARAGAQQGDGGGAGTGAAVGTAAERLAARFAPVFLLKAQDGPCDPDGEPYEPIAVDAVLANPQVLLRQVGNGNPVLQRGPAAADLFDVGGGFYLDFPGDALAPGCTYEQDGRRSTRDRSPTVYAHVVEHADGGHLVLQYWSYWYFNDWNNTHESDWEGIALLFDVPTADEALGRDPVEVGYAQHEGGERAAWDDDKLDRDGERPIVYASAGSHASYYGAALYLGRGASEGFGCDTTDGPHRRVDPRVVLLPTTAGGRDDPFAWLAFEGRWGERQRGAFNGPTGPAGKARWADPMPWFDDLRASSVIVPAGDRAAGAVVHTFCAAVELGSDVVVSFTTNPTTTLLAVAGVLAVGTFAVRRTRWDRVPPLPVRARRRFGQILRATAAVGSRRLVTFAAVGLVHAPIVLAAAVAAALVGSVPVLGSLIELAGRSSAAAVVLAVSAGSVPNVIGFLVVNAVVADLAAQLEADGRADVRAALRRVRARWRALTGGFVRALVTVVVLLASVIGIPWAIRQAVRYQFLAQVVMDGEADGTAALRRSSALVRGTRWWYTAMAVGLLQALIVGGGTVLGLLLLIGVPSLPLWGFSVLVGLLATILVPFAAFAMTLLYGDALAARQAAADAPPGPAPAAVVAGG